MLSISGNDWVPFYIPRGVTLPILWTELYEPPPLLFFFNWVPCQITVMKGFFSWQGLAVILEQKQASPTPSPLGLSCIVVFSTWLPVAAVTEHCVEVTTTALCALWVNKLSGVKDSCWNPHSGQKKWKKNTEAQHMFHLSLIWIDWIQQMVLFVGVIPHLIVWYVKTRLNYLIKEKKKAILNLKTRTKAKLWSEMAIVEYKMHSFCVCVWDLDFNMNKNSAGVFGSSVSAFQTSMQRHFTKKLH